MFEAVLCDDVPAFNALWASAPFEEDPDLRQRLRVIARLVSRSATAQTRLIRRRERDDYVKDVVDRLVSGPFDDTTDSDYGADCAAWAYFGRPQEQLRLDVYALTQICVS